MYVIIIFISNLLNCGCSKKNNMKLIDTRTIKSEYSSGKSKIHKLFLNLNSICMHMTLEM